MDIFVISLKKSKDRRVLIKKELDHLGMPFSFFNAIDGKLIKLSYQKEMTKLRFEAYRNIENLKSRITLSHGHVGCALSHIKIYSHIVKKKIPLLIFCTLIYVEVFLDLVNTQSVPLEFNLHKRS